MCRKPSRVACQQSPQCMPDACQSAERLLAHRGALETLLVSSAGCAAQPRRRSRAESTLAMNCSVFAVASFTALPPLTRDCSRLRGLYGWPKNGYPRTRARACATPLTRFYGKAGILLSGSFAHSGRASDANLADAVLCERETRACASFFLGWAVHLTARVRWDGQKGKVGPN